LLFVARVSDRSGALFWEGFFLPSQKKRERRARPAVYGGSRPKKKKPQQLLARVLDFIF
jgi:hypothetical protein